MLSVLLNQAFPFWLMLFAAGFAVWKRRAYEIPSDDASARLLGNASAGTGGFPAVCIAVDLLCAAAAGNDSGFDGKTVNGIVSAFLHILDNNNEIGGRRLFGRQKKRSFLALHLPEDVVLGEMLLYFTGSRAAVVENYRSILFFRRNAAADGKEHPAYYQGEGAFD